METRLSASLALFASSERVGGPDTGGFETRPYITSSVVGESYPVSYARAPCAAPSPRPYNT